MRGGSNVAGCVRGGIECGSGAVSRRRDAARGGDDSGAGSLDHGARSGRRGVQGAFLRLMLALIAKRQGEWPCVEIWGTVENGADLRHSIPSYENTNNN